MKLSYSKKLYYKAIAKLLVVPLALMIPSLLVLWYVGNMILASATLLYGSSLILIGYFTYPMFKKFGALLDTKIDPLYNKYIETPLKEDRDAAKRGIEGERIVSEWLEEIVPKSNWFIAYNQEFKGSNGSKFDIDAIIVGPRGVFVLEIKNLSYDFLFTTEDCAVWVGDEYRVYSDIDPRVQVAKNAHVVEKMLKAGGLGNIRVNRAVVSARHNSIRFFGKPLVFLTDKKESLRKYLLESFEEDPRFTLDFCEKAYTVLTAK